ncbi:MAG: hypothetical protein JXD22_09020 [Sedimentisphaerales bacterium]|nr:hypothetical protein [Sedimentisphaerales bacterium]
MDSIKSFVKLVLIILLLALPAYLGYKLVTGLNKSISESNPHPATMQLAIEKFFSALQNENHPPDPFETCYQLLPSQARSAVGIGLQDRQAHIDHFARIRKYLVDCIGPDFLSTMKIEGNKVTFFVSDTQFVTLTVEVSSSVGTDEKRHFGIRQIQEFPFDLAPKLGNEERNRYIEDLMDTDKKSKGPYADVDDPYELMNIDLSNLSQHHLRRLIELYKKEPQLDTRHNILEYILINYYDNPSTATFFKWIQQNEPAPHLRLLAQ